MGCNYYHRTAICTECGSFIERHIGKSSGGWQFCFQGYRDIVPVIRSFSDWKRELEAGGKIFDEYNGEVNLAEFIEFVESKQSEPNNHHDFCGDGNTDEDWKDTEGYSFSTRDFS